MTRTHFNTAASSSPAAQMHPAVAACALDRLRRDGADQPAGGPGWFDSSWDLTRGLDVREGVPPDANVNEWLAAWLRA